MDSYDEMNHLQRRSRELQSVSAELEDIKDWMAKNTGEMQSGLLECVTQLESAIEKVDQVKGIIDEKADEIENQHRLYADLVLLAEVSESENPALARPVTLAEVKATIRKILGFARLHVVRKQRLLAFDRYCESILQRLNDLDQGPVASSLSKALSEDIQRDKIKHGFIDP